MPLPDHILAFLAPHKRREWRESDEDRDPEAVDESEYTLSSTALTNTKTASDLSRRRRNSASYNGFTSGLAVGVILGFVFGFLVGWPL